MCGIFGIVSKAIRVNPEKYIGLLEAPIFNPHYCNIAEDPFKEEIPYLNLFILKNPHSNIICITIIIIRLI